MAQFRTRARAVDMLGRQQIAGIPTAISELFKNAHDAYADRVEVDFYRSDGLFVLRDDGVGMTREDFERRWLTLGTESKTGGAAGLRPPPTDPMKPERPTLGEKGIGRLSIAAIGPQVLVLTRAKSPEGADELVAAFIHWALFRLPGVDLEDIEIPVRTWPAGTLPTRSDIQELVCVVRDNFQALCAHAAPELQEEVERQLDAFDVDPVELDHFLGVPTLSGQGHGTQFIILPAEESLAANIDGPGDDDAAPALLKMLVGFTNTMTPNHAEPPIRAAFRDHRTDDSAEDLIGEREFFSPEEFASADHHIAGAFDEFGQFRGTVTIYNDQPVEHIVPWNARGRQTECGPFRVNFAVVQGKPTETRLPLEEWAKLTAKMNRIGGLYIYKDGIRVLPYGNNDFDFLDIERNRTKSASYYYFSYRRIFGAIEIDGRQNAALSEKAGREGFRENRAYRQFRDILKNFFVQTAADFFREGGTQADRFIDRKSELDRVERARRRREKMVSAKRSVFAGQIEGFFSALEQGRPAEQIGSILGELDLAVAAAASLQDPNQASLAFIEAESVARRELRRLQDEYRIVLPRGIGLTKSLRRDFEAYQVESERLQTQVFEGARKRVEEAVGASAERARIAIDRRIRFERALEELSDHARKGTQQGTRSVREAAQEAQSHAAQLTRESLSDVEKTVREVLARAARLNVTEMADEEFVAERTQMEDEIQRVAEAEQLLLREVAEQLRAVVWTGREDGDGAVTDQDMAAALEEEVLTLRERSEADLELVQLGMAIQVINHEFDSTIKGVRSNLRDLRAWADSNAGLRRLYDSLRSGWDHLDGYLTLFTPLQRRLYRYPVMISGAEIEKFLRDLFADRFERHEVTLKATGKFQRWKFTGYPSTFYPVFVNLVDNAVFWMQDTPGPRVLTLHVNGDALEISDTGPGISPRHRESIFEMGFTKKPGGRGLGLYISRAVLRQEGCNLSVVEAEPGAGATFRIEPKRTEDEGSHRA